MESHDQTLFIQGFNNGYLLEQHESVLLAKVLHNLSPSTEYISGLASGQKQYRQERTERELDELSKLRDGNRGVDRSL
jgi:hypothetical protein